MTGGTESEGWLEDAARAGESIWARKGEPVTVTHGTQTSGSRVLWGDQGPAYAEGWRDCALSLAADFDDLGYTEAAALAREAAGAPGAWL